MTKNNNKKGFTIIEVVLVLAIAGLIFLMVFVALPALQRSQRDTQRRDDMSRLITAIQNFQANNNHKTPEQVGGTALSGFVDNYLTVNGDSWSDPSTGQKYTFESTTATDCSNGCSQESTGDGMGVIHSYKNATCDGENPAKASGAGRLAFTINLEGTGIYCVHN